MDSSLFLVARVTAESTSDVTWLVADDLPYTAEDPIDFIDSEEIGLAYDLYVKVYSQIDPKLNVLSSTQLADFNRWVLVYDSDGQLVAIALFRTETAGLKLGVLASDGTKTGRDCAKRLARLGLNVDGVFAEVSEPLESVIEGRVPEVPPEIVSVVLQKDVALSSDGRHYTREISNVGPREKLLVGRPILESA